MTKLFRAHNIWAVGCMLLNWYLARTLEPGLHLFLPLSGLVLLECAIYWKLERAR